MDAEDTTKTRKAPATVVNGTRVTVAFPLSKITIEDTSEDVLALSAVVADLAEALAASTGDESIMAAAKRAAVLRDRLAG